MKRAERPSDTRAVRPALASRILALGLSVAATLGLLGAMSEGDRVAASPDANLDPAPIPTIRVVFVERRGPSGTTPSTVSAKPRIVRRYVRAPAKRTTTTTKGS